MKRNGGGGVRLPLEEIEAETDKALKLFGRWSRKLAIDPFFTASGINE